MQIFHGFREAMATLRAQCAYQCPTPHLRGLVQLSLGVLAVGFIAIGIASWASQPDWCDQFARLYLTLGSRASLAAGSVFLLLAFIIL